MPCQANSLTTVGLNPTLISCKNIRIYHDCLVWIENSVPRVTVPHQWYQTVIPRDSFLSTPNSHGRFFSLHTLSVFIAFWHFKCQTFTNILTVSSLYKSKKDEENIRITAENKLIKWTRNKLRVCNNNIQIRVRPQQTLNTSNPWLNLILTRME